MSGNTIDAEQRAHNFVDLLASRPGMILSDNRHLLHRVQAFIAGLKWANAFSEAGDRTLCHFLCSFESSLTKVLLDSDSGVGWIDELMSRTGGDEQLAYDQLIFLLRELAIKAEVLKNEPASP